MEFDLELKPPNPRFYSPFTSVTIHTMKNPVSINSWTCLCWGGDSPLKLKNWCGSNPQKYHILSLQIGRAADIDGQKYIRNALPRGEAQDPEVPHMGRGRELVCAYCRSHIVVRRYLTAKQRIHPASFLLLVGRAQACRPPCNINITMIIIMSITIAIAVAINIIMFRCCLCCCSCLCLIIMFVVVVYYVRARTGLPSTM